MYSTLAILFALLHPSALFFVMLPFFIFGFFREEKVILYVKV